MTEVVLPRRRLLTMGGLSAAGLLLSGCDRLSSSPTFKSILGSAEKLTYGGQRALQKVHGMAREFSPDDISPVFKPNGTTNPDSPDYVALRDNGFRDWRLKVGGLVTRPLAVSLADLQRAPRRTQITRHDCVEGWSAIGQWSGVPLGHLLRQAGLRPEARYIVFHCFDTLGSMDGSRYYESIDLADAFHPQTILADSLNGRPVPVANGAPVRVRIERQLGYKSAKYLDRVEAVARLDNIQGGKGGYWEDRGYEWYAGI